MKLMGLCTHPHLCPLYAPACSPSQGVLRAKAAVASSRAAVVAAVKARAAAEKAQEYAELARAHAEGAARELLTAKKAEIQAAALLEVCHAAQWHSASWWLVQFAGVLCRYRSCACISSVACGDKLEVGRAAHSLACIFIQGGASGR